MTETSGQGGERTITAMDPNSWEPLRCLINGSPVYTWHTSFSIAIAAPPSPSTSSDGDGR